MEDALGLPLVNPRACRYVLTRACEPTYRPAVDHGTSASRLSASGAVAVTCWRWLAPPLPKSHNVRREGTPSRWRVVAVKDSILSELRVRLNSTQISVYPGAPFNSTHLKLANSTKDLPWVGNRGTSRRDTFQVVPSRLLRVAAALPFLDTYPLRIMELFKRQQVP